MAQLNIINDPWVLQDDWAVNIAYSSRARLIKMRLFLGRYATKYDEFSINKFTILTKFAKKPCSILSTGYNHVKYKTILVDCLGEDFGAMIPRYCCL